MTKGFLFVAVNNPKVDYLKQAYYSAKELYQLTGYKSAVITDGEGYLRRIFSNYSDFLTVIPTRTLNVVPKQTQRRYHDGLHSYKMLPFQNEYRVAAYEATPFDETLLIDTDIIWRNKDLFKVFDNYPHDIAMYKTCECLNYQTDVSEFNTINENGIPFYWATCVFFRKGKTSELFFKKLRHLYDNWYYYRLLFNIRQKVYRNDTAFSLAIHMLNDYMPNTIINELPGTLYYATDQDIYEGTKGSKDCFRLGRGGHYVYTEIKNENIHVMNKFSLGRYYDQY